MSSKRVPLLAALLLASAPVPLARAAPPAKAISEADVDAARTLYREARTLDRQGKIDEAIAHAEDAFRLAPTPVIGLELGRLLLEARRVSEAYAMLTGLDSLPLTPHESDRGRGARQEAATLAASVRNRLSALTISARRPDGVDVEVDGARLASDDVGQPSMVDPGVHNVTWRRDGRACASLTVRLVAGDARSVELGEQGATCSPPAPVIPPAPHEDAKDVKLAPSPPPRPLELLPPPAAPAPLAREEGGAHPFRWIGVGALGTGLVALTIGEAVGIKAKNDYDGVAAQCPAAGCTPAGFAVREGARSDAQAANVAIASGVALMVGGAGAVVYDLFFRPSPKGNVKVGFTGTGVSVTVLTD
ncbi:MAG TPA: tetratricopeptide repeat protein [Polyangiaceae bacterium]